MLYQHQHGHWLSSSCSHLILLPANLCRKAWEDVPNTWGPTSMRETWKKFPAHSFGLTQFWPLWPFGQWTGKWNISFLLHVSQNNNNNNLLKAQQLAKVLINSVYSQYSKDNETIKPLPFKMFILFMDCFLRNSNAIG